MYNYYAEMSRFSIILYYIILYIILYFILYYILYYMLYYIILIVHSSILAGKLPKKITVIAEGKQVSSKLSMKHLLNSTF